MCWTYWGAPTVRRGRSRTGGGDDLRAGLGGGPLAHAAAALSAGGGVGAGGVPQLDAAGPPGGGRPVGVRYWSRRRSGHHPSRRRIDLVVHGRSEVRSNGWLCRLREPQGSGRYSWLTSCS